MLQDMGCKVMAELGTWVIEKVKGVGFACYRISLNRTLKATWLESSLEKDHTAKARKDSLEAVHLFRQEAEGLISSIASRQAAEWWGEKSSRRNGCLEWGHSGVREGRPCVCISAPGCIWSATGGALDSSTRNTVHRFLHPLITLASFPPFS